MLRSGKRRARKRWSEADAEVALAELLREYADELGWHYSMPRPYYFGSRPPRPRSGVTPRVRFAVLESAGFTCRYCGAMAPAVRLVVDHVVPVADGGSDDPDNLVAACVECNAGKADRPLTSPLPQPVTGGRHAPSP